MDASERWNFDNDTHNPEPAELGLCSPVFSFDSTISVNATNMEGFALDGPLIDLEEGWAKPEINEEWSAPAIHHHHHQQQITHPVVTHHSIYHEPGTNWAPHPMMQQQQQQQQHHQHPHQHQHVHHHQQMHPSFHQHVNHHPMPVVKIEPTSVMLSPFTLDSHVVDSINDGFHHSISQCDSDSERSDRSGHSDRTTGLSSSSQSSYLEHSPVSSHSDRSLVEVLTTGLTAADLRRPRVQRKRRMTGSSIAEAATPMKPVAMMDEEEKRERNKQSASDYRKRRKNYVSDLENRLDAATSELSRKEEALRVALNEITSLKEQVNLFHTMTFKKEGQVSIPISTPMDPYHTGHKRGGGIGGISKGRRVSGAKGAMSIAMLTLLSCLLCQFGFFDTSIGGADIAFSSQGGIGVDTIPDIAMSTYQAGAPDCSTGGCNKNRFLYWETDNQMVDSKDAHVNAVMEPSIDLDVDTAFAQMQAVVNATEVEEWMTDGPRTPMGYLDVDSLLEDSDRELDKSIKLDGKMGPKLDLVSMIASLFRWTTVGSV